MKYHRFFSFSLILILVGFAFGASVVGADPYNPADPNYDGYLTTLKNNADYWRQKSNRTLFNGANSSQASAGSQQTNPRYAQCLAEYNRCDEPCLTRMGIGSAAYGCHNACARNFDNCVAGNPQQENMDAVKLKYQLKQRCDNLRGQCEIYTCDKVHGMAESRACFASCKAQAEQCMTVNGLGSQPNADSTGSPAVRTLDSIQHAALNGDVAAQVEIGNYWAGAGDEKKATAFFEMAARQGHPQAQFAVANRYYRGLGVEKNATVAARWLHRAAEQGLTDAQGMLGYMYLQGDGVDRNLIVAHKYLTKAAEAGSAKAYGGLGWVAVLLNRPLEAIRYSRMAIAAEPLNSIGYNVNLAHGLLLNGQYETARDIYVKNKDSILQDGRSFKQTFLDDFNEMRKQGINHPGMHRIEGLFRYLN